jgi:putative hydrolase of the HAD superfamily
MIQAVLFDIYGTLIDIQTDEASMGTYEMLSKWLEYKNVYITPDQLKWLYQEEFAIRLGPPARRPPERDVFKEIIDEFSARAGGQELYVDADVRDVFRTIMGKCCGVAGEKLDRLATDLSHLFRAGTRRRMFIFPTVKQGLEEIGKSYRLGIVSNAQEAFTLPELDMYELRPYFETIVLSSQARVKKPNAGIFKAALDRMGLTPREAAFVGNDLFADIMGAGKLGMRTIYVGRRDQGVRGVVPDATVSDINLYEVRNIVDRWNEEGMK